MKKNHFIRMYLYKDGLKQDTYSFFLVDSWKQALCLLWIDMVIVIN
jgi:hypothetical protein